MHAWFSGPLCSCPPASFRTFIPSDSSSCCRCCCCCCWRPQVSLYLLLMEARYQLGLPPAGLLWNVNNACMSLVPAKHEELAPLLACRNRLAAHLWQEVPPPHQCSRCSGSSPSALICCFDMLHSTPHSVQEINDAGWLWCFGPLHGRLDVQV